jgi:hypothetical protein
MSLRAVVSRVTRSSTPHRILTRHFLRCFLENDLMSPEGDRAQLLAVTGALLLSSTIFISVVMAFFKYVVGIYTPGQLAVSALDDRFFYVALSMIVLALLAAAQWDALVVDVRDASILEPLPVRSGTIRRAKLAAVAIMGAGAAVALNAVPSVVFPLLMLINQSTTVAAMGLLMAIHLAVTLAAGTFAYLTVIAFRETLAAVLGPRWFPRVSPWAQGALIVILGSALLLLPPSAVRVERTLRTVELGTPPMWFLGVYEVAARGMLIDGRRSALLTPRMLRSDAAFTAAFRRHEDKFPVLARRAAVSLGAISFLAAAAYAWNTRRLPALAPPLMTDRRRRWVLMRKAIHVLVARDAAARAGFFFTLAAISRSRTHRLTLACSAAVGLAMAVVALSRIDLAETAAAGAMPARLLSVQALLVGALVIGFRHAIRVPAELRATWGFELAWRGRERQFLSGVKRAAIAAIALPALAITLPLFVFVLGPALALAHAAIGLAGAIVLLELLLAGYEKVPFTCTYLPNDNIKLLAPLYVVMFLMGSSIFAGLERSALQSVGAALRLLLFLGVTFIVLRIAAARRRQILPVDFNEAPATTQRLGLHT